MSMTIGQVAHHYLGKYAWWRVSLPNRKHEASVLVPAKILDGVVFYGRVNLLIQPMGGIGTIWVSDRTIEVVEDFSDADKESKDATHGTLTIDQPGSSEVEARPRLPALGQ